MTIFFLKTEMIDLPKNLKDFDINIEYPFTIFEKKNLFEDTFFNKLLNGFPSEGYFKNTHTLGNKKYFNNNDTDFNEFLNTSSTWNKFYNHLNSKKFLNEIFNLCKDNLKRIEQRKQIKTIRINKKSNNNLFDKFLRKIKKGFGVYETRLAFEFSIMKNGSYIPPHNDTSNKLISLMIYFPDSTQKGEVSLGTNFFKNSKKNLDIWKGDMLDEKNTKIFFENYEKFYTSKFEKNKIVGFIKSKNSWHDVSKIHTKSSSRKSLNINLYLIN